MTDADYESIKNKYKEFIEYNKPKLLEFLQNVPYEEFTAALKNKLGVENLHIKYEIKEKQSSNSFSCYYVYYTSNDLTEESKLLSTVLFKRGINKSDGYSIPSWNKLKYTTIDDKDYYYKINKEN